jgi:hypothetical protein
MDNKLTKVYTNDTWISMLKSIFLLHTKMGTQALVIIKLNSIFPLHAKLQDSHLKYPNVLYQMPWCK